MDILLKQKEEEWNTLLRLKKRKEEIHERLVRRKHVLILESGQPDSKGLKEENKVEEKPGSGLMFLPQGGYTAFGNSQIPLFMMNQLLSSDASSSFPVSIFNYLPFYILFFISH